MTAKWQTKGKIYCTFVNKEMIEDRLSAPLWSLPADFSKRARSLIEWFNTTDIDGADESNFRKYSFQLLDCTTDSGNIALSSYSWQATDQVISYTHVSLEIYSSIAEHTRKNWLLRLGFRKSEAVTIITANWIKIRKQSNLAVGFFSYFVGK